MSNPLVSTGGVNKRYSSDQVLCIKCKKWGYIGHASGMCRECRSGKCEVCGGTYLTNAGRSDSLKLCSVHRARKVNRRAWIDGDY